MSVTDETKAVAQEAATVPAEAEPTKEVAAAAEAPVEEKKEEEESKVSEPAHAFPEQTMHRHFVLYCPIWSQPLVIHDKYTVQHISSL